MPHRRINVLAVSSGGGHWVQLQRLRPAFENASVTYVTVHEGYRAELNGERFFVVNDATSWDNFGLVKLAFRMMWIVLRIRPDVVISTGAAPGYFGIRFGKLIGARTIWVDSIANVEKVSMSAEQVRFYADLWLTQWPHLACEGGPQYKGGVL